jgi:hypothetical protein
VLAASVPVGSRFKGYQAFPSLLRAGHTGYFVYRGRDGRHARPLPGRALIARLAAHPVKRFADETAWTAHLAALGIDRLDAPPDPVRVATEAALWGAIRDQSLLTGTVIVSDGVGQFRVGTHALCWIHAERLVHRLVPATPAQRQVVETTRSLMWFYGGPPRCGRAATGSSDAEPAIWCWTG